MQGFHPLGYLFIPCQGLPLGMLQFVPFLERSQGSQLIVAESGLSLLRRVNVAEGVVIAQRRNLFCGLGGLLKRYTSPRCTARGASLGRNISAFFSFFPFMPLKTFFNLSETFRGHCQIICETHRRHIVDRKSTRLNS